MNAFAIDISVVMPAMNERDVMADTVDEVRRVLEGESFELIVVDDGSTDGTWEVVTELASRARELRGVRFTRNFGHQAALHAGLAEARGRAVVMMDSDGEHPPALLPELIACWRKGARVVQGVRDDSGTSGMAKRVTSRGFYRVFSWLAETELRAGSADFRLLDRSVVELMAQHPSAVHFLRGFVPWSGFETEYVEFKPSRRTGGETKYSSARMLGLARQGILRFSVKPLRISTLFGGLTCGFSLAYLVYILVMRFFFGDLTVAGWASIAGLLALLGGVQLLVIGILGEYVGIIFETLKNPPRYIVSERCGVDDESGNDPGGA